MEFLRGLGMACEFKVQGSGSYLPRLSTICLIHLICGERKNTTGSATLWRCTNWSTASGGRRRHIESFMATFEIQDFVVIDEQISVKIAFTDKSTDVVYIEP